MAQQGIHFAPCGKTGRSGRGAAGGAEREYLDPGRQRHPHQAPGALRLSVTAGQRPGPGHIIRWLARLPGEHIVIACAAIREEVPDHLKALVRRSYTQLQTVAESPRTL